jgi:hypothetical protein
MERKRKLISLIIALDDMMHAEVACDILFASEINEEDPLYQPILTAVIVSYARPFKKNKKLIPLSPEWCSWHNESQKELHRQMIGLRDTALAHSDSSMHTVRISPVFVNGERASDLIKTTVGSGDLSARNIPGILALIRESMQRLDREKIRLINELCPSHSLPDTGIQLEI